MTAPIVGVGSAGSGGLLETHDADPMRVSCISGQKVNLPRPTVELHPGLRRRQVDRHRANHLQSQSWSEALNLRRGRGSTDLHRCEVSVGAAM